MCKSKFTVAAFDNFDHNEVALFVVETVMTLSQS